MLEMMLAAGIKGIPAGTLTIGETELTQGVGTIYIQQGISGTTADSFLMPERAIYGHTIDPSTGNLITMELFDNEYWIHDGLSAAVLQKIPYITGIGNCRGIDFDVDNGNLITCDASPEKVYINNGVSGSVLSSFAVPNDPTAVAWDPFTGNIVVGISPGDGIYVYTQSGVIVTSFTLNGINTDSMVVDPETGNLITADNSTGLIQVHDGISATVLSSFASPASDLRGGLAITR